jgi:hypothetical protein
VGRDHSAEGDVLLVPHVARVAEVGLLVRFPAREAHLFGVDDDDVVTRVEVRRVHRLVLSTNDTRQLGGQTTERLVGRVDQPPAVFDVVGFRCVRSHDRVCSKAVSV